MREFGGRNKKGEIQLNYNLKNKYKRTEPNLVLSVCPWTWGYILKCR